MGLFLQFYVWIFFSFSVEGECNLRVQLEVVLIVGVCSKMETETIFEKLLSKNKHTLDNV
jgi:hypothetical protein